MKIVRANLYKVYLENDGIISPYYVEAETPEAAAAEAERLNPGWSVCSRDKEEDPDPVELIGPV